MKRFRLSSLIISVFIVFAMTAVFVPAAGALLYVNDGSMDSYAATQPVEFGYLNPDNSIDKINSLNLGTLDLSKVNPDNESTYKIEKILCIKGLKDSGLVLESCNMEGDISSGDGGFSGGTNDTHWDNGVPYLTTNVIFDASALKAGTYSAVLYMHVKKEVSGSYTAVDLNVNGGTVACNKGVLSIPMTITLTGINSAISGKVGALKASAGNDLVTLTWNSSEKDGPFSVYRRDGTETASPENIDLTKYEEISEGPVYTNKYFDNSARNGKTYSYFVILGDDLEHTYPSNTATATPSKNAAKDPLPPVLKSPDHDLGKVILEWTLDQNSKSELDIIDHFNVYRNGNLVAQVDQNAYKESVEEYWDYDQDKAVAYHVFKWTLSLDTDPAVAKWWVTAVSKDGVEGSPSEKYDECPEIEQTAISGWLASYVEYHKEDGETDYKPAIYVKIHDGSYYNADFVKLWKKEGNGEYNYLGKIKYNDDIGSGVYDYADVDITKGKTYTYKATVIDSKRNESEPVEFTVRASEDGASYTVDYYYSLDDDNNPVFGIYGESGYTYSLLRKSGNTEKVVSTQPYNGSYITLTDNVKNLADGTYYYYLKSKNNATNLTATTGRIPYVKDTAQHTMELKPGTPTVTARVSGENKDKIVLRWNKSSEGGEPDGYYIYKKISQKVDGKSVRVYDTSKFNKSDDYISTWWMQEYPQDRYIRLRADKNTFTDTIDWGYEDQFTVKYWVRAYNQYGESDIDNSLIASYDYNEGNPRSNGDSVKPGKPIIKNAWAEPDAEYDDRQEVIVTWEAPVGQGGVDYYKVTFEKKEADGSWSGWYSESFDIGEDKRCSYTVDTKNYTGTYRFIVKANNKKGSSEAISDEINVSAPPKILLSTTSLDKINVEWTDANDLAPNQFTLYRKEEYGLWTEVTNGTGIKKSGNKYTYIDNSEDLEEDTRYMYRVEARDSDTSSRLSLVKSILLSPVSILPGQPTELTAVKIDSYEQYLLTWKAPTTGGTPLNYRVQCWNDYDKEWTDSDIVPGTTTSYAERFFVDKVKIVAENDAGRGEASNEFDLTTLTEREDSYWPHSILPSVEVSTEEDDEPFVTLRWKKDTESNWGEAAYYSIYRYDGTSYAEVLVADVPAREDVIDYSWTDRNVESGMYYEYYLRPTNSYGYNYVSDYGVWAAPESKKETSAAKAVRKIAALIDRLPAVENLDVDNSVQVSEVTQINELYESLSNEQKTQVNKVDPPSDRTGKLSALINKIENAKAQTEYYDDTTGQYITKPVQDQIDAACNAVITEFGSVNGITTVILEDSHKTMYRSIRSARAAYEALSDDAKRTVNTDRLSQIEDKINSLKQGSSDYEAADAVLGKLKALPTVAEYESKTGEEAQKIEYQADAARRAYGALLSKQLTILKGMEGYAAAYQKLTALEESIAHAEDKRAAANVDVIIDALPDTIRLSDKSAVENARSAYNVLTDAAKSKVTKLSKLVAAENTIAELESQAESLSYASEVAALIDALPEVANVSLDDESSVIYAQMAYENLSDEQKALVNTVEPEQTRTEKLERLINRLAELREGADKTAAEDFEKLIDDLPASVTSNNFDAVRPKVAEARSEYDKLTNTQKAYVHQERLEKLANLEDDINEIVDNRAAEEVRGLIQSLPDENDLKLSDEGRLNNAYSKYNLLTLSQKALLEAELVEKLGKLNDRMTNLKTEQAEKERKEAEERRRAEEEAARRAAEEAARVAAAAAAANAQPPEVQDLPAIKISKPKAAKKKLTAKWKKPKKKDLAKIQGIEVRVVGPGVDTTATTGAKKTSRKFGGLQSKQKYTVMVRAYRYDGGVKHVSAWKSKKVKVK